jgi:glycine/D-amino acid oxidase-like deaminating enzyme
MRNFDAIVVGGGMVGPAIGYGLVQQGLQVAILDEGDRNLRAAKGNFGLVWFQGKGLGMPRYVKWTFESTQRWPNFHTALQQQTGLDSGYRKTSGLHLCVGDDALSLRHDHINGLRKQEGDRGYACEFIDRQQTQELLPDVQLGQDVVGASYSAHDGHANPLLLMRALHQAFRQGGGTLLREHHVTNIEPIHSSSGNAFRVHTENAVFECAKVVLAAGHGVNTLAPMVGLDINVQPQRGQILVTERLQPMLSHAMSHIRQTEEGSVMLGDSQEDVGYDTSTTLEISTQIAQHAVRAIPALARARMVRTWAALRVLTADKFPVYAQSKIYPGAFVAVTHSGVTLAAMHAERLAPWIAGGEQPDDFDAFSPDRFIAS